MLFFFLIVAHTFYWASLWLSSENHLPKCSAGDVHSVPGLQKSPGEENDNPLQYYCLGIPMDRGAWQATVHGISKSQTQLSDGKFHFL